MARCTVLPFTLGGEASTLVIGQPERAALILVTGVAIVAVHSQPAQGDELFRTGSRLTSHWGHSWAMMG